MPYLLIKDVRVFKRENKNRPREESSKKRVRKLVKVVQVFIIQRWEFIQERFQERKRKRKRAFDKEKKKERKYDIDQEKKKLNKMTKKKNKF